MRKNDKQAKKRRQKTNVRPSRQEVRTTAHVARLSTNTTQSEMEYVFQQYYTVTVDECLIDNALDTVHTENTARIEFERIMFKRMFSAIQNNPRALHDVCTYQVLAEQESMGGETYASEYYGAEKHFAQILAEHASCFAPEDRAWLLDLLQRYQQTQITRDMQMEGYEVSALFDLDLQVEPLQEAFHVELGGFSVGQHEH